MREEKEGLRIDDYQFLVVGQIAGNESCNGSVRASKSIHELK
ncbi:MAG: hypothetical protein WDA14_11445 [Sphaerochaetaceae bacterium]